MDCLLDSAPWLKKSIGLAGRVTSSVVEGVWGGGVAVEIDDPVSSKPSAVVDCL